MAWSCSLIFLYRAAVRQDWLGEGSRRSGPLGHLYIWRRIAKSSAVKTDKFWGDAFVCACVCTLYIFAVHSHWIKYKSLIFCCFFPLIIFLFPANAIQFESYLLSLPPGPLTKKQESTMNRPKDEGILIAIHPHPPYTCSALLFKFFGDLCLYLCVIIY